MEGGAAAGLDYAHRACDAQGRPMQIVHRDVTPHNVLVSFDGAVKLIDFGVAKAVGRLQHTEGGVLRGKYPYMSPEQVTSGELDHRSDQVSLGAVLWELLSAGRLFKADNDAQTLERVAQCVVPPPVRKDEVLPGALRFGLDERVRAYALKKLGPDAEREARARLKGDLLRLK